MRPRWSVVVLAAVLLRRRRRPRRGFTTATSGTGTWGIFDLTTGDVADGLAVLRVFQESAEDGHPIDVYEVPVTVG
jgi:hypothetical protein